MATGRNNERLRRLARRVADALPADVVEEVVLTDPRRAPLVMTGLQLDTVLLGPSGPNVDRARIWLAAGVDILRSPDSRN